MKKFILMLSIVITTIFTPNNTYANWYKESNNQRKETTNVNGYIITTFKLITIDDMRTSSHTNENYYIIIIKSPNGKTTEVLTNGITTIKIQ